MNKFLLATLLLLPALAGAQVYEDFSVRSQTTFPGGTRTGNVYDASALKYSVGVPLAVGYEIQLVAPNVADVDYFVTTTADMETTATVLTLANTANQTNDYSQRPFARSVTMTFSTSDTGSVSVVYLDAQNVRRTKTLAIAAGTAVESDWTAKQIVSITVTDAVEDSTTVQIGFGDSFGVPFPTYYGTATLAGYDAAGDDFPTVDTTNFARGTDWTVVPGKPDDTTADPYGTIDLTANDTDPDGTACYAFVLPANGIYLADPSNGYADTSWSEIN